MQKRTFKDFNLATSRTSDTVKLAVLTENTLEGYKERVSKAERNWLEHNFFASDNEHNERYNRHGELIGAALTIKAPDDEPGEPYYVENPADYLYSLSGWAQDQLSPATYKLSDHLELTPEQKHNLVLGWGLGKYKFEKYKSAPEPSKTKLVVPDDVDKKRLLRELNATYLVQDLINEPPNVMSPDGFAEEAKAIAEAFGASVTISRGDDLLPENDNFPLVHAVGKAAEEPPQVVDIRWGDPSHPAVTLSGKGVIFDTGGNNMKDDEGMLNMKYDMAGAAHALGVAYMVMDAGLPVNLRVILPIVRNDAGAKAYLQSDIITSRKGDTVEIRQTDAEGRLIMADALYEAAHPEDEDMPRPELLMDFTTLGWHGTSEYPGFGTVFSNHESLKQEFLDATHRNQEYFAPRPFIGRLKKELTGDNTIADIQHCNMDNTNFDDLLAATFLRHFVGTQTQWLHMDLSPWRTKDQAGTIMPAELPSGGFAQGVRSAYDLIERKFGTLKP